MTVLKCVTVLFTEVHPLISNKSKDKQAGGVKKGVGRPRK